MSGFLTVGIMKTAVELGLIYALVAMALFISYSILNIADLSTDGSYTLGTAVSAVFTISGHRFWEFLWLCYPVLCPALSRPFCKLLWGLKVFWRESL